MKKKIFAPILLLLFLITGLFLASQVPYSAVSKNLAISATELNEIPLRHPILGTHIGSYWDVIADATTCSIIATNDGSFSSLLAAQFLEDEEYTYAENFARLLQGEAPNCSYARYWHGATGIYRILLTLMPISGIRVTALALYLMLMLALYAVCLKKGHTGLFGVTLLSHVVVGIPGSLCSLETIPIVFLCVLSELLVLLAPKEWRISCFAMFGIATAFFDFLTTETLTLTVPLLVCMYLGMEKPLAYVKDAAAWLLGYAGTFLLKWGLSALICSPDSLVGTGEHIMQWLSPDWEKASSMTLLALFCWAKTKTSAIAWGIGLLLVVLLLFLFFRAEKVKWNQAGLLLAVNLIPLARFVLLNGHAAEHWYFVPRMFLTVPLSIGLLFLTQSVFSSERK